MSKGDTFENDWLKLIFHGTPIANLADNAGASPLTQLWVSLHTADPGEAGSQATNECAFGAYARIGVNRNSGGWTITGNSVSPAADITFLACTSGSETVTHFGVGVASVGATKLLYRGVFGASGVVSTGVSPKVTTASTITEG